MANNQHSGLSPLSGTTGPKSKGAFYTPRNDSNSGVPTDKYKANYDDIFKANEKKLKRVPKFEAEKATMSFKEHEEMLDVLTGKILAANLKIELLERKVASLINTIGQTNVDRN